MKSFFNLFIDSAKSLKNLRTLATTGMLLAMAIAIRSLAIQVTPDLRIVFTCIPISLIGLLYGPVVCGMSTFALDLIGFLIDNKSARGYSIELAMVVILSGIIYGIFLYKHTIKPQWSDLLRVALARFSVIFICNICLNSYFLYTLYINPDFTLLGRKKCLCSVDNTESYEKHYAVPYRLYPACHGDTCGTGCIYKGQGAVQPR